MTTKAMLVSFLVALGLAIAPRAASADDCLEVGWRDNSGAWSYYRAWVEAEDGNQLTLRYDYHHGRLELKVFEKEKPDGRDVIVLRGRWYEGKSASRSGKVRMELEKGRHRAKGWYTIGDDVKGAAHYDFALRDCKK